MSLHKHILKRALWLTALALWTAGVAGCPRELEIPDAAGSACTEHADCNQSATCGTLRACVFGHCEVDPSLLVPCDGGTLIDASVPDASIADRP